MRRGVIWVWLAACSTETKQADVVTTPPPPPPEGPIEARIAHYDVDLDLATRVASAKLTIDPENAGTCVTVPFRAATTLEHDVTIDGVVATTSIADGALTACGPSRPAETPLVLATTVTLADQTLPPTQIGFTSRDDFTYLLSWVGGCDLFVPCDSRPDRFATSRFTVHHAPDMTVRCPGMITETDDKTTVCDFPFDGGPTYSTFGLVAARDWRVTDAGDWGGVRVEIYDRPGTGIAKQIVKRADFYRGFVAFMTSRFGPYPYGDTLRILTAPTYWNGFEHPGNIVLSEWLPHSGSQFADPLSHIMMHELAHMWAGNQTTIATIHDFAWKEAVAEYLAYVYEDSVDPDTAATTLRVWRGYAEYATHYPVPDDKPPLLEYYAAVYGASPIVFFRQIERLSSREQVMAAIGTLLGRPRAIGVDDVRKALEAKTGLALEAYFDAWVFGQGAPAWPRFTTRYADGKLAVAQTGDGGAMPCKFDVVLHGEAKRDRVTVAVDTLRGGREQTIAVEAPSFPVARTEIDPDHECLAFESPVPSVAGIVPSDVRGFTTIDPPKAATTEARDVAALADPAPRAEARKERRDLAPINPWVATPRR
jgi:aminopeptidase N